MPTSTLDVHYQAALEDALKTCAEERIHQLGKIQPVGVLLAVDETDLTVRMVSDNLGDLFHLSASQAIGQPLAAVIGASPAEIVQCLG